MIQTRTFRGGAPRSLGTFVLPGSEYMSYQYYPLKLADSNEFVSEPRLAFIRPILDAVVEDVGPASLEDKYVYATVKRQYLGSGQFMNRLGWHIDGFGTPDLNYIWCDANPTVYSTSEFRLTMNDIESMVEMQAQAQAQDEETCVVNTLYAMDETVVHRVNTTPMQGVRTFVKISISKDKYDLAGNAKNYGLDYDWPMRPRDGKVRNVPQSVPSRCSHDS